MDRALTLTKDQVAERLAAHVEELRSLGVRSLELFDSTARGDARPDGDVDLLVKFGEVPGFIGNLRVRNRLEAILGRHVDLVMASGLQPRFRERVLREARHGRVPLRVEFEMAAASGVSILV